MKKFLSLAVLCCLVCTASAVPARRGWQTRTQADGSTIEIQVIGDEYYHYSINRAGERVREVNGMYEVVGQAPTAEQVQARRVKKMARRQRKDIALEPNLAPKGVVILANFSDEEMSPEHDQAVFDELCNSLECTVNNGYPSAAQFFADQSNGSYRPQFDVFGPVTLSRNVAYYGTDIPGDEEGDDQHATDAVVEACILADEQYEINWADYDSNQDGYVDFVYVIYAGMGQADGGSSETIWPHNWSVAAARYYGYCTYSAEECVVGGKTIDNYAMSGEISGGKLTGIGTLCHEFGHVMGLPDLYDITYGSVYENCLTPADWNIMDAGSYNGDGHCPPNYDPWQKDFFGWLKPENLGSEGQQVELIANGTEGYRTYQINASGEYVSPTTPGLRYYIENRQPVNWDAPLTGHGMLLWKIDFDASAWNSNAPNGSDTQGAPRYTIVSATGDMIGRTRYEDYCPKNTFPGSGHVSSCTPVSGKPLFDITEKDGVVTLTYIEAPTSAFVVRWVVNGEVIESAEYVLDGSEDLTLPQTEVIPCEGTEFVGWTTEEKWCDPFALPEDLFNEPEGKVTQNITYYALFH